MNSLILKKFLFILIISTSIFKNLWNLTKNKLKKSYISEDIAFNSPESINKLIYDNHELNDLISLIYNEPSDINSSEFLRRANDIILAESIEIVGNFMSFY